MKIIESVIKKVVAHESVKVVMPTNLYGCELGEGVFVGPFVEIQKNAKIVNQLGIYVGNPAKKLRDL